MTNLNYNTVTYYSDNEVLERLTSRLNTVRSYHLHELLELVLSDSDCSGYYGFGYLINLPGLDIPVGLQIEDNLLVISIQDNHCEESYISVNIDFVDVDFGSFEVETELFSHLLYCLTN